MLSWYRNKPFQLKLILPLGLLALVILLVLSLNYAHLTDLSKANRTMGHRYLQGIELILQADRDLYQAQVAERSIIVVSPKKAAFTQLLEMHSENIQQVDQRLKKFKALAIHQDEHKLIAHFFKRFEEWKAVTQQVVNHRAADTREGRTTAIELSFGDGEKQFEAARELLDQLSEDLSMNANATVKKSNAHADRAKSELLIGVAILIIIVGLLIFSLPKVLTGPLFQIRDQLLDLAEGEADLTARINVTSKDELGEVSNYFNVLMDRLQQLIRDAHNKTVDISDRASQLRQSSESTGNETQSMKSYMDMVATAIEELGGTARDIASNTTQAADNTQAADKEVGNIQEMIQQTVADMTHLAGNVTEATQGVDLLKEEADGISSVVDVIRGIAEQTNLLALNAAIEAARAGEQGRGFAVVADEVRSLASRTQESTADIQKMIEQVQTGVNTVVTVMREGAERADSTLQQANSTNDALHTMTSMIVSINDMVTQIATAAEQQSSVVGEISQSVNTMHEISDRCTQSAENSSQESETVLTHAADLKKAMEQFKV